MGKSLTTFLNNLLKDSLDEIDSRLRVTHGMEGILRACDKKYSFCANYPKGHGELFNTWMEEHHHRALLLHVERTTGSRNDLIVVYWNNQYWVEFLDDCLRISGDNILKEQNLFVVLSSLEIIALSHVCSIVHLAICLPIRWLASNSHLLAKYNWSIRSMGRVVDILESALGKIILSKELILDEAFMLDMFKDLRDELKLFHEYWLHMFDKKRKPLVADLNSKVVHFGKTVQ